ncbi:MAG: acyl-CoA dehydrogenase family protein, partial [Pseudomonadales bacterium]
MDLSYSSEHRSFQEEVRDFLESHAEQAAEAGGLRTEKGLAWQQTLIEHGYTARTIPKEYGGFGAEPDILKARIIAEEFATAGVSPGLGGQGISMLVPTLLE